MRKRIDGRVLRTILAHPLPALRLLSRLVPHLFSVVVSLDFVSPTAFFVWATNLLRRSSDDRTLLLPIRCVELWSRSCPLYAKHERKIENV